MVISKDIWLELLEKPDMAIRYQDELKSLVEQFPWNEHARILYTRALKQSESGSFEEELMKTAVFSSNRDQLFEIVMRPVVQEERVEPQEILEGEVVEEIKEQKKKAIPEVGSSVESFEEVVVETVEQEEPTENIKVIEPRIEIDEIPVPEGEDILEKQILTNAVSKVIEKEVVESDFKLSGPVDTVKEPEEIELEEKKDMKYSSYTQWLLKRSKEMDYEVNTGEQVTSKEKQGDFELNTDEPIQSDKRQRSQWIDEFISKNPKITPGKVEEYEIQDYAKASLKSSEDFITETMALIYVKQGKINKAKQAYRLLSLKYPEKSIYFAARIKELDKKIE